MEQRRFFFEKPTMVKFFDVYNDEYMYGIAVNDYIICSCCGGKMMLEDIYDRAPTEVYPVIECAEEWIDFNYCIKENWE